MQHHSPLILASSDFYLQESKATLPKLTAANTPEEAREILAKLQTLQKKIAFEIREIDKVLNAEGFED